MSDMSDFYVQNTRGNNHSQINRTLVVKAKCNREGVLDTVALHSSLKIQSTFSSFLFQKLWMNNILWSQKIIKSYFMKVEKIIEFFSFNYLPIKKQNIFLPNDSLTGRVLDWQAFPPSLCPPKINVAMKCFCLL